MAKKPRDEDSVDVVLKVSRPLTQDEEAALADLRARIAQVTAIMAGLKKTAVLILPSGARVKGDELKKNWSRTDFVINEVGFVYANRTTRGEADYNGGNPRVSYNIDTFVTYHQRLDGMAYLVLHEQGHMTKAGRDLNARVYRDGRITPEEDLANERQANDVARAVANAGGMPIMPAPTYGYSDGPPLEFKTPSQ